MLDSYASIDSRIGIKNTRLPIVLNLKNENAIKAVQRWSDVSGFISYMKRVMIIMSITHVHCLRYARSLPGLMPHMTP